MEGGHHLILGELTDILTGETIPDTHDERYRQKIASILLRQKGYSKDDIRSRREIMVAAGEKRAILKVDFEIFSGEKTLMVIQYGPGSLLTRRRPALALARLAARGEVPVVVVTNGEDAEILDGQTGEASARGPGAIPSRRALFEKWEDRPLASLDETRLDLEGRIAYAYEVDGACPCDDSICRL
ncbi:conserved hypothetical protein [Candidatus Desulfarcum epimagneticum]|uniref:Type I restriction enzyme R protein N-terminal domain-containing protein n=1 Tax=uncultured Desulfobacteraceae bacterium TaxID=218296 RepID=A0A484HFC7_9BACT|nr:conserved hypothetical protein [uncultured Desulfobacteraceae bacterium]